MNKAGTIFEVIWLVMGGLFLFIGVDITLDTGIGDSWYYFAFGVLALIMYLRRRRIRISNR